jgi:hypothetical protein
MEGSKGSAEWHRLIRKRSCRLRLSPQGILVALVHPVWLRGITGLAPRELLVREISR